MSFTSESKEDVNWFNKILLFVLSLNISNWFDWGTVGVIDTVSLSLSKYFIPKEFGLIPDVEDSDKNKDDEKIKGPFG